MNENQNQNLPEGVSWHPQIQRWRVDVKVGRKNVYIGSEETIEKASQLYEEKKADVISRYSKEIISDKITE